MKLILITFAVLVLTACSPKKKPTSVTTSSDQVDACSTNIVATADGSRWNFSYVDKASGVSKYLFRSGAPAKYSTCGSKLAVTDGAYINVYEVNDTGHKYLFQSGSFNYMAFLPNGEFVTADNWTYDYYLHNSKGDFVTKYPKKSPNFDPKTVKWFKPFADESTN